MNVHRQQVVISASNKNNIRFGSSPAKTVEKAVVNTVEKVAEDKKIHEMLLPVTEKLATISKDKGLKELPGKLMEGLEKIEITKTAKDNIDSINFNFVKPKAPPEKFLPKNATLLIEAKYDNGKLNPLKKIITNAQHLTGLRVIEGQVSNKSSKNSLTKLQRAGLEEMPGVPNSLVPKQIKITSVEEETLNKYKDVADKLGYKTERTADMPAKFLGIPFTSKVGEFFGGKALSPADRVKYAMKKTLEQFEDKSDKPTELKGKLGKILNPIINTSRKIGKFLNPKGELIIPKNIDNGKALDGAIRFEAKFPEGLCKPWGVIQEGNGVWQVIKNLPKGSVHRKQMKFYGPVGVISGVKFETPSKVATGHLKESLENIKDFGNYNVEKIDHIPARLKGLWGTEKIFGQNLGLKAVKNEDRIKAGLLESKDPINKIKEVSENINKTVNNNLEEVRRDGAPETIGKGTKALWKKVFDKPEAAKPEEAGKLKEAVKEAVKEAITEKSSK